MKELSIEEKAKRYDEAIEKAEKWHNAPNVDKIPTFGNRIIEDIFPELYESEGEKLRKEMLQIAKESEDSFYMVLTPNKRETLITLFENQGEQKSMKVYRVENEAEQKGLWRKFDGTYQPLFDMLTDGKCKDLPMEDSPIYREGGNRWFASVPSKETLQKWFSKEDLEELVAKGFTISEFEVVGYKKVSDFEYIFTRDNVINRNYLEVSDIYPEQKDFAPKVGPKFKVGDWVVFNGLTLYINEVVNGYYRTISKGGIPNSYDWDIDNAARLWTIEDAKDGDVLACNEELLLFKSYSAQNKRISLYCWYNGHTGNFHEKEVVDILLTTRNKVYPASKEQRDLLFQKMGQAGYEWDAEQKELKKIEDEPENYKKQLMSEMADLVVDYIQQKPTWKPTEKQIDAIRLARSFVTDDFSDNPTLSETLLELENQLKKIMEG